MQKIKALVRLTNREIIIVTIVAIMLLSVSAAAFAYTAQVKTNVTKPSVTPTATASASPSAAPSATPAASTAPSPSTAPKSTGPKPTEKPAYGGTSPQGSPNAPFQVASILFGAKSVICHDETLEIVFRDLIISRHYTTTASGTAVVNIEFSNGMKMAPIYARFPAGPQSTSTFSNIRYSFPVQYPVDLDELKYRAWISSPNSVDKGWWSINSDHPTIDPSCSLE